MRAMTQPPPSSRCNQCGGELRLKQIETVDRELNLENEILVCANCDCEHSLTVNHDRKMPQPNVV
jgi:uncharacterized protein with PIN domain